MNETVLLPLAPLDPRVWVGRRRGSQPFPLREDGCRLFARARHGLLHGLRALGIGHGDEILTPAYHHGSEVEALERAGARCVFYDCDEDLAPDAAELERLVGGRTRALHITHHLGFPQDAARWRHWCDERGVALIEDAAQAWLARSGGRPAGAYGDLAVFSLYKTFGLPDGGALVCRVGAERAPGPAEAAVMRLGLEHAAWVAGRSRAAGAFVSRVRRTRAYDAAADRAMGAPRPPSRATLLALRRVVDPGVADLRRDNYDWLGSRVGDLVPPTLRELRPGASPLVLPIAAADKPAMLTRLRASGVRALDLWSVPHPSLARDRYPRADAFRRTLLGLPVHQELRRKDLERIAGAVRIASAS
jgi:DegT/DnrJ/EryC1/StrS aminotransferase family